MCLLRRWLPALAGLTTGVLLGVFSPSSEALTAPTCDTHYTKDFFHACFFSGTDPNAGQFLGTVNEPNVGSPAPDRAYGINRDYGSGPVFGGVSDNISGVWRGKFFFDGRYLFTLFRDDGVRVYIDEQLVLDKWSNTGWATYTLGRQLARGYHNIRVEWYESSSDAQLRLHWDKGPPVPPGAKVSPLVIDAFVVKRQDVCIAGNPWTSGTPFNIHNPDGSVYKSWQIDGAFTVFPQSDPACQTFPQWENFSFGFTPSEIANARSELNEWAANIQNWSLGAIQPTLRIHDDELVGEIPLSRNPFAPQGLYLSGADIAARAKLLVSSDTDLTLGFNSVRDINTGRFHQWMFCGLSFGPGRNLGGVWGAPYAWIPGPCLNEGTITHEAGHLTRMIFDFHGSDSIMGPPGYPIYPPYPAACFTDAERAAANPYLWFPDADYYIDSVPGDPASPDLAGEDPTFPWCRSPILPSVRPQAAHNLLWHFDPSLNTYRLNFLTGNHCNDLKQDFGEPGSDTGAGICPGLPPAVSIPAHGLAFTGTGALTVAASTYETRQVEISIDGVLVKTDMFYPFDYTFDTRSYSEGSHTVTARAIDWGGLSGTATATIIMTNVDTDADGFLDGFETYMGTDPFRPCPATSTPNDEAMDAWPPDFNDDTFLDITDITMLSPRYGAGRGDPNYDPRFDLNADGFIDIYEFSTVPNLFGQGCN